jgi:hypothetical protein
MYQLLGLSRDGQLVLIAETESVHAALSHYREAQLNYLRIIVHAPNGDEIDAFGLNRRADKDLKAEFVR